MVQAAQVCMLSAAQYFVPESSQFGLTGSFSMSAPFESRASWQAVAPEQVPARRLFDSFLPKSVLSG
jgi:hypothetical protein